MTAGGKGDGDSDRAAGAAKELEVRFYTYIYSFRPGLFREISALTFILGDEIGIGG